MATLLALPAAAPSMLMFDTSDLARRDAQAVLHQLEAAAAGFTRLPPNHPHRTHGFFCELYVASARTWLDLLADETDSAYFHRFIAEFFDLYRRFVLDALDDPPHRLAPHWRAYHALARRLTLHSPISLHLLLISLAVRAHLRFDQGAAMCTVERRLGLADVQARPYRTRLFGVISDRALCTTALAFVSAQTGVHRGWRRLCLHAYRIGLLVLKPIWLPTAQAWRKRGFADADRLRRQRNRASASPCDGVRADASP